MAFEPTPLQRDAINAKGNVLVSAAAGSGKTAVLTTRVASHIAVKENHISADRILVVTFTKAAAAEMRSRIESKLAERLENDPNNTHLIKQMLLFPSAKICTIDSFCIELVRENFDKLGVSPDFKIVEDNALNTIRNQALSEVFEEQFAKKDADFLKLLRVVGSRYDDSTLADYVKKIHEFSSKLPNPTEWLLKAAEQCDNALNGTKWRDLAFKTAEKEFNKVIEKSNRALRLLEKHPQFEDTFKPLFTEPKIYAENLLDDVKAGDWNALFYGVSTAAFTRMSNKKIPEECSEILLGKKLRKECTEKIKKLNDIFFDLWENISENNEMLHPLIKKLVELVISYDERVNEKMSERNVLTFYRTEQLAFELLCKYEEGKLIVNDFAKEYISNFDEVLVDEYQDTNPLQDMLFRVLSNNEEKLFLVGDVKQSIYGFRGANPSNFLQKKQRYLPYAKQDGKIAKKIILASNFRSRSDVCEFINFFFTDFMTAENGEIDYGAEERLFPEAKYPTAVIPPVEIALVESDDKKTAVAEADYIAQNIIEIMNSGPCIRDEKNPKILRPARYSDFCILLRSAKKIAPIYASQLTKRGIPISLGTDLFLKSREVGFIMSLLDIVDNPTREISLCNVMLSGFFGFIYDDLALIKAPDNYKNLYNCVVTAAKAGDEKCERFAEKIKQYRRKFTTLKISGFIDYVFEDLGLLSAVCCFKDGNRRRENLLRVLEFALTYEENEGKSVAGFLRFLENVDEDKLKNAAADGDTVKISTIHHSKGLQFPVCYLANCAEGFSTKDSASALILDEDFYFSFKFFNPDSKRKLSTIQRQMLIEKNWQKQLEEELRLLYVALTRAQDRLVMIISGENLNKKIKDTAALLRAQGNQIDRDIFAQGQSFADWLLPAVLTHSSSNELRIISEIDDSIEEMPNPFKISVIRRGTLFSDTEALTQNKTVTLTQQEIEDLSEKLNINLKYVYPYDELLSIASKASVSQLAHSAEFDNFAFSAQPAFASRSGITATQRGIATHRVMQFLDFSKARVNLEKELDYLAEWQFFSEEDIKAVDTEKIRTFLDSSLCQRIINSKFVRKEMRFLTEKPAIQISAQLDKRFADESIVIQGAVDCLFEEDGEIVVVDFKTDRVPDEKALADTYREQLRIYAVACEKIFSKPVKEMVLYSFHLNKEIKL